MCSGLRGHLRSRFLVLSDDRVLPPAPSGRGKRAHPDTSNHQGTVKRPNTSVPPPHIPNPFSGVKASFAATATPGSSSQFVAGTVPVQVLPHQAPLQVLQPLVSSALVHSPGGQFPPLVVPGVKPISDQPSDGYQKVRQRKPRKSKAETATAEATKAPTPSRIAPPRSVKATKTAAPMDVSPQDESDRSSECSESDFVDAPPQVDS